MKYLKEVLLVLALGIPFQNLFAQSVTKPVYVLVHGAWGGGWGFKHVDSLLTTSGNIVYRPTLTGQGERMHLANENVGLDTHIKDVVNTILFEELNNIILVGHSYGGMVVTGVADSIPDRIKKLIYVDALVPEDGENVDLIIHDIYKQFERVDGYLIPPWVSEGEKPPKDVPHPTKTWTDKINLNNPERLKIPTYYILTVEKGLDPKDDEFAAHAQRANNKGWPTFQLDANHNPQWSAPEEFVKMLNEIVSN